MQFSTAACERPFCLYHLEVDIHLPTAQSAPDSPPWNWKNTSAPNLFDTSARQSSGILHLQVGYHGPHLRKPGPSSVWLSQRQFAGACIGGPHPRLAAGPGCARKSLTTVASRLQQGFWYSGPQWQDPSKKTCKYGDPRFLDGLVHCLPLWWIYTLRAQDSSRLRIQSLQYRSQGPLGKDYFRTTIFFPANFVTLLAVIWLDGEHYFSAGMYTPNNIKL